MMIAAKERSSIVSDLICLCVIIAAMYLLTPRFWEPGGETWKYWTSARILKDTGGFPVIYYGPLYIAYLQIFLLFKYPLSLHLEYFVTHLFCYTTIFFLLRGMMARIPALLLLCAWIPLIATIEGSTVVAGMGFMALYILQMLNARGKAGLIPPSLGAAALCHSSCVPFLIGHVFGSIVEHWKNRRPLKETWKDLALSGWRMNTVLLILLLLTLLFPSQRWDHNYMQMDQKYVPVPLKDPLTIGFFMAGNFRYMLRTEPSSEWINGDWYFTHIKAYAGATTIWQAITRKPLLVARNLLASLLGAVNLPLFFMFGIDLSSKFGGFWLAVLSWNVLFLGCYGMIRRFFATSKIPLACAMAMGIAAVFVALSLVWFGVRYQIVLLPAMFCIFFHVGPGYQSVERLIPKTIRDTYLHPVSGGRSSRSKGLLSCGVLILLSGLLLNETTLACLLPAGNPLLPLRLAVLAMILTIDLAMIVTGAVILLKANPAFFSNMCRNIFRNSSIAVSLLAVVMIGTAFYSNAQLSGIQQTLGTRYLLNGSRPVSMMHAHQVLLPYLNRETRVLSLEETWIKAFADVSLDHVYHLYSLPPFSDPSGETEKTLNELNMIFVSHNWTNAQPSTATQAYLRSLLSQR